jgi:hypothetical protein
VTFTQQAPQTPDTGKRSLGDLKADLHLLLARYGLTPADHVDVTVSPVRQSGQTVGVSISAMTWSRPAGAHPTPFADDPETELLKLGLTQDQVEQLTTIAQAVGTNAGPENGQ